MKNKNIVLTAALSCVLACGVLFIWNTQRCHLSSSQPASSTATTNKPLPSLAQNRQHVKLAFTAPADLIARLQSIQEANQSTVSEALFCFQGLVDAGTNSLPSIETYFLTGHNISLVGRGYEWEDLGVDYTEVKRWESDPIPHAMMIPQTTRIGLIDALCDIGGTAAVEIINQVFSLPSDLHEFIYAAITLYRIDPAAYKPAIVAAIRDKMPLEMGTERTQLLRLLAQLGDNETADLMLSYLRVDGLIDFGALDLVTRTLGEKSMYALSTLFHDSNIGFDDRTILMKHARKYVGSNQDANEMFKTSFAEVFSETPPSDTDVAQTYNRLQFYQNTLLTELCGYSYENVRSGNIIGRQLVHDTITPETAQARLELLNELRQKYAHEGNPYGGYFDIVEKHLQYALNPGAATEEPQYTPGMFSKFDPSGSGSSGETK